MTCSAMDHVRKAISLSLRLSSSSMKFVWWTIVPWLCIVGATACRGGARSPPLDGLPVPRKLDGARLVGALGTVGDGGRCDASKFFERLRPTSGVTSSVVFGRCFDDVNARRRFIIDEDVRVSRGICGTATACVCELRRT